MDIPVDQAYQYWEENYVDIDYEDKLVESIDKEEAMPILNIDEVIKLKENLSDDARVFYAEHYDLAEELLKNSEFVQAEDQTSDSDEG